MREWRASSFSWTTRCRQKVASEASINWCSHFQGECSYSFLCCDAEDFLSAGHGQQNGESLNNLLKTLHGYYFRSRTLVSGTDAATAATAASAVAPFEMPNKAEFVCYFVLFQLGNGGEVSKYLQQLPDDVLNSPPVRFAVEVWGALKTHNYAKYFRLLRTRATLLQACLMHRYVGEVRMVALRKLTRSMNPPGAAAQDYPLEDVVRNFMFENADEAVDFLERCGLAVCARGAASSSSGGSSGSDSEGDAGEQAGERWVVSFQGQNIDALLERDKNDRPIMPPTHYMHEWIDRAKSRRAAAHASQAPPGFETHYSIAEISRGLATASAPPALAPMPSQVRAVLSGVKARPDGDGVRVRTPLHIATTVTPPPAAPAATLPAPAPFPAQPSTTIDRAALRNKLLMSGGLNSGRAPKPAASPIAPITDDDVWGPSDTSATSGASKSAAAGKKKGKIAPTKLPEPPVVQAGVTKPPTPPVSAQPFGGGVSSALAARMGTDSRGSPQMGAAVWPAVKPPVAPPVAGNAGSAGVNGDSWRKQARPQSGSDSEVTPKPGAWGSEGKGHSGGGQQQQGQVSAFSAMPAAAVPAVVPAPLVAFPNPFSLPSIPPAAGKAAALSPTPTPAPIRATPVQEPKLSDSTALRVAPAVAPFLAEPAAARHSVDTKDPTPPQPLVKAVAAAVPRARPTADPSKLAAFERKVQQKRSSELLAGSVGLWKGLVASTEAKRILRCQALYFLFWRQALRRVRFTRQAFVRDIKSIKLIDSMADSLGGLSLRGEGIAGGTSGMLKRKQADRAEAVKRTQVIAQSVAAREHLLCDPTLPDGSAVVPTSPQHARGLKTLLGCVGETLRTLKTCQVRELLGYPVPDSVLTELRNPSAAPTLSPLLLDGPQYTGPVCFKLAILSAAPCAGVEDKADRTSVTSTVRSFLANETGYGFTGDSRDPTVGKNQSGKMRKRRGLLAKALASTEASIPVVRVGLHTYDIDARSELHLSVVDVCGDQAPSLRVSASHNDLTAQVSALSSLRGAQAALVMVTVTDGGCECTTQSAALLRLSQEAGNAPPVLLMVVDARRAVRTATDAKCWDVVTPEQLAALSWVDTSVSVQCARDAVSAIRTTASKLGRGGDSVLERCIGAVVVDNVQTSANCVGGVRECLQEAVLLLASHSAPTPILCQHHTEAWLHSALSHPPHSVKALLPAATSVDATDAGAVRAYCHDALVKQINMASMRVQAAEARLVVLQKFAKSGVAAVYPAPDLAESSRRAVNSGMNTQAGSRWISRAVADCNALAAGTFAVLQDALLPADWQVVSKYDELVRAVSEICLPSWQPDQPVSTLHASLMSFFDKHPSAPLSPAPALRTQHEDFLESLDAILNNAYQSGSVADVDYHVEVLVQQLLRERLSAAVSTLPQIFYAVATKEEVKLAAVQMKSNASKQTTGEDVQDMAAHNNGDNVELSGDGFLSPVAGADRRRSAASQASFLAQPQYAQAFPTGFGRSSLFAAFGAGDATFSSPTKSKRLYEPGSPETPFRASVEMKTPSGDGADRGDVEDSAQYVDTEALFTAAFKKTRYSHAPDSAAADRRKEPVTALQEDLSAEREAGARLEQLLQQTLRGGSVSALSSPHGEARLMRSPAAVQVSTDDPMAFILQCRREREQFERIHL
jgi:hypothetical protein